MKAGASVSGGLGRSRARAHLPPPGVHPAGPPATPDACARPDWRKIEGRSNGGQGEIEGRSKEDQGEIEGMDRSVDGEGDQQWRHLQPAKGSSRWGAFNPPARMLGTPARGVALTSGVLPERGVGLAGGLAPGGEVALAGWLMRR